MVHHKIIYYKMLSSECQVEIAQKMHTIEAHLVDLPAKEEVSDQDEGKAEEEVPTEEEE